MADPSNSMPRSKASSSSAGVMANDFRNPSTSVNQRRMKRTSRSSTVRSTYSCCLSIVRRCYQPPPASSARCYPEGMERLRLAGAQINPVVGDLDGNVERVLATYGDAAALGAHLVVFPELAVCGYPPEDLVFKPSFLAASRADRKSTRLNSSHTVISYAVFCLKKKKKKSTPFLSKKKKIKKKTIL